MWNEDPNSFKNAQKGWKLTKVIFEILWKFNCSLVLIRSIKQNHQYNEMDIKTRNKQTNKQTNKKHKQTNWGKIHFCLTWTCSERDYVITHSVCSTLYVRPDVCSTGSMYGMWYFAKFCSLYPQTLMYSHGTWIQWSLGRVTHVTSTGMRSEVI